MKYNIFILPFIYKEYQEAFINFFMRTYCLFYIFDGNTKINQIITECCYVSQDLILVISNNLSLMALEHY